MISGLMKKKTMTQKLQLVEQNYRYLFENASDPMLIHDMDGYLVDANAKCAEITGYNHKELIGKDTRDF